MPIFVIPGVRKNRIPYVFLRRLFFGVLLVGSACGSLATDEFVDDAAIKSSFETRLTELFEAGGLTTGAAISRQLRNAGPMDPPIIPEAIVPAKGSDTVARARAATLVFGHLYLCDKCSKHHANLAGGVVISPDGLVLTNYHVLDFHEAITFGAMTADGVIYPVEQVVAASRAEDLALVKLQGAIGMAHVPLAGNTRTGEELFVMSHPDAHFYTLTKGFLARKYLDPKSRVPRLQITADFAKGSSGSGVFNTSGELVGIATSTNSIYYDENEGKKDNLQMVIKSAVPIETIRKLFTEAQP